MSIHASLISLSKAFGYHEEGCCRGVTMRWIESCLLHDEDKFHRRLMKIDSEGKSLVGNIGKVKKKVQQQEKLTAEDEELLEILAFYESLELYHSPEKFHALFNAHYFQGDMASVSCFAASSEINGLGGLTKIYSEPGIYTANEIKTYLDEFETAILQSDCAAEDVITMILGNVNHTIGLSYQKGKGWKLMDINQYSKEYPEPTHDTKDIAEKILFYFKEGNPNRSPYVAFDTSILVIGHLEARTRLSEQLVGIKQGITEEIAKRVETINLAWIAARGGHIDVIRALGNAGADLNKTNNKGVTPLFMAVQNGHLEVVKYLYACKVDIKHLGRDGSTPLFMAAQNGHLEVVKYLLEQGADIKHTMTNGATPLFIAAQNGHTEVVKYLLEHGADIEQPSTDGATPLFIAAHTGHTEVVKYLLEHGANIDQPSTRGATPLFIAAHTGHTEVVKYLLEHGANIDQPTTHGATPLFIAVQNGHTEVVNALMAHNAMLDIPYKASAESLRNFALHNGNADVITRMDTIIQRQIDSGEDEKSVSVKPVDIAWIMGHTEIFNKLSESENMLKVNTSSLFAHKKELPKKVDDDPTNGFIPF